MPKRVYVSVPGDGNLTERQLKLKKKLIAMIAAAGLEPQSFGEFGLPMNEKLGWNFDNVDSVMSRCCGAIIIALSRHRFLADDKELSFPTEFNHYEGAVAMTKGLPTLIVAEAGLESRGIVYHGGGRQMAVIPQDATLTVLKQRAFSTLFEAWVKSVQARQDVFLGYCSQAQGSANAIMNFLGHQSVGVTVMDWVRDFPAGGTIMEGIQLAARQCESGIFLFTRDDLLEGEAGKAAPRDNVIFEAGFFMHAKGPKRTLIIRETGAKMPADLGGAIYVELKDRNDISSIQDRLRAFVTQLKGG